MWNSTDAFKVELNVARIHWEILCDSLPGWLIAGVRLFIHSLTEISILLHRAMNTVFITSFAQDSELLKSGDLVYTIFVTLESWVTTEKNPTMF